MKENLFNLFLKNVEKTPEKVAYKFEDTRLTYREVAALTLRFSRYLERIGVKKGTHIGVIAPNSVESALLFWAASYMEAVLVPLMPGYPADTIKNLVQATDIELILAEESILNAKKSFFDGLKFFPIPNLEILQTQTETSTLPSKSASDPSRPYIITLTSGSTSQPKPIVFSQETKIARSLNGARDLYGIFDQDITIVSTPMYHSMGMRMTLLPLLIGSTGVIMSRFSPAAWIETVKTEGVTFAIVVSNQIEAVLDYLEKTGKRILSLKKLVSSSYTLKLETKKRFLKYVPCRFYECYGTSEIGIATNIEFSEGGSKLKSVGEALDYVDIKILDQNEKPLPPSMEGEIAVKSPTRFSGYYKNDEATQRSFCDEYFKTGDIGSLDNDGFLYYWGRGKDVIKHGAINLYPTDIENVLLRFTGVKECAVIGKEDAHLGEVPVAAIVANEEIKKKDLRLFCLDRLADYQVPVDFVFVNAIPKNELGKVQKFKLKENLFGKVL